MLVDAGLSAKEIARRLALVGEDIHCLDGVLVTHEHGDHVGGLRVLLRSVDCPVYISATTCDAYISERANLANDEPRKRAAALSNRVEQIESSKDFRIGEIDFHPFTIPHDAADNFGFTATHQGVKIATLMDFGHITTLISQQLRGCAAIMIESNHSRDMLKACDSYPWELKQRILSRLGHISNEDIAEWLRDGFDGPPDISCSRTFTTREQPLPRKNFRRSRTSGASTTLSCRTQISLPFQRADALDRGLTRMTDESRSSGSKRSGLVATFSSRIRFSSMFGLALLAFVLTSVVACGPKSERRSLPSEVEAVINTVTDDVAAERYEKIYNEAADLWKQELSLEETVAVFKTLRTKLGKMENRTLLPPRNRTILVGHEGNVFIVTYNQVEKGEVWKRSRSFSAISMAAGAVFC